jgi:hypothetical protein
MYKNNSAYSIWHASKRIRNISSPQSRVFLPLIDLCRLRTSVKNLDLKITVDRYHLDEFSKSDELK